MRKSGNWAKAVAAASLFAAASVGGCATIGAGSGFNFRNGGGANEETDWVTSRVSLGPSCVMDDYGQQDGGFIDLFSILGPVVLPHLIDTGLNFISRGIRDVASMTRTNVFARTNSHFLRADMRTGLYRTHEDLGCVIFAYGRMTENGVVADSLGEPWSQNAELFQARNLNLAAPPLFYFEGIVRHAENDEGLFSIETAYVHISPELRRTRLFGNDKDAILTFTFQRGEGDVIAVGAIPFADIAAATTLSGDGLSAYSTSWMVLPAPSERDQVRLALHCQTFGCPDPAVPAGATHTAQTAPEGGEEGSALAEAQADMIVPDCSAARSVCAQPFTLVAAFSRSSNIAAALTEIADQFDYARPAITPHLVAEATSEATERLNVRPPDPARAARLTAAHEACTALVESRRAYEAAEDAQRTAMAEDVRAKIRTAQTTYEAADLEWWNVTADSALGCSLTRGWSGR